MQWFWNKNEENAHDDVKQKFRNLCAKIDVDVLSERMNKYTFAKLKGRFRDTIISQIRTEDDDPSSLVQDITKIKDKLVTFWKNVFRKRHTNAEKNKKY